MEQVLEGTTPTEEVVTTEQQEEEVKTYTKEEVDKLLQQETDRRVTSALKKQEAKFNQKMAEADKLRDMDESQRKEYEFNQRVAELESREKEFNLAQNKIEAMNVLAKRNLPVDFVNYVVADDAETMMDNINNFERMFKSAVSDAVSKKIASKSPTTGNVLQTGLTKEQFDKLSIREQAEIYNSNPSLYNEMIK